MTVMAPSGDPTIPVVPSAPPAQLPGEANTATPDITPSAASDPSPSYQQAYADPNAKSGQRYWLRKWKLTISSPDTQVPVTTGSSPKTPGATPSQRAATVLPEVTVTAKRDPSTTTKSGQTMDLSLLHITFTVEKGTYQSPTTAVIRVYNLGLDDMAKIAKQYKQVTLEAGYQNDPYGIIFKGTIAWFEHGKQSPTETMLTIHANELDVAVNNAAVNATLPAGVTHKDVVMAAATAMAPFGLSVGYISKYLDDSKSPRSRTVFGMARDVLRDITRTNNATASIDGGQLNIVRYDETLPSPAIVLNTAHGMIGIPSIVAGQGVHVRSLLNPAFKANGSLRIDQRGMMQQEGDQSTDPQKGLALAADAAAKLQVSADGSYKILKVTHTGDNRGNAWYSDLTTEPSVPTAANLGIKVTGE
jgi:hypothetical protein